MVEMMRTTSLTEIRDFLRDHGCAGAPWERPEQVIDRLYDALRERRSDDGFWTGLKALTGLLDDRRFNLSALDGLDPLCGSKLDRLIDDLRRELGDGDTPAPSGVQRWFRKSLNVVALTGFLLLGSAVACDMDEDDGSKSNACHRDEPTDLTDQEQEVYDALVDLIESADIGSYARYEMLECLPCLDAAYRERLLAEFSELEDYELADRIYDMTDRGRVCDQDDYDDSDNDH